MRRGQCGKGAVTKKEMMLFVKWCRKIGTVLFGLGWVSFKTGKKIDCGNFRQKMLFGSIAKFLSKGKKEERGSSPRISKNGR